MKKQNGITLIALVITIIVLLILTSITLGLLLGENGIINKSRKAAVDHEIGREKEEISLAFNAVKIEKLGKGDDSYVTFIELQEQMDQENGEGTAEVESGEEEGILLVTFTKSKRTYEIDQNGNIKLNNDDDEDDDDLTPDIEIYAIEDLVDLSIAVNNGETYEGKVIGLMKTLNFYDSNSYRNPGSTEYGDLNGNGTTEALISELNNGGYNPIGVYDESQENSNRPFKGTFDGKNNSIKHMRVVNKVNAGFFGYIEDATIKNFKLEEISTLKGNKNIGAIVAYTGGNSKLKNCSASNLEYIYGADNVGGLVGISKDNISIKNSKFETIQIIRGDTSNGGIIGKVEGNATLENISTSIENYISAGETLGGAIGEVKGSVKVKNFSNEAKLDGGNLSAGIIGKVTGLTDKDKVYIYEANNKGILNSSNTSGIIGSIENVKQITLQKCYNTAEVRNGGIIGTVSGESTINAINNCYNEGNMSQYSYSNYTSGIIGSADGIDIKGIANSYNTGSLRAGKRTGGIIGSADNTNIEKIYKCYNEGTILTSEESAGGICGYINGSINIDNCYNKASVQHISVYTGGIIGYVGKNSSNVQIDNSCNEGELKIYSKNTAGIIAQVDRNANNVKISINNTYNNAQIISEGTYAYVGGILGSIEASAEIKLNNCNNTAQIQGKYITGGIIANVKSNKLEITNTYNTGEIIGGGNNIAGITGQNEIKENITIDNCYNKGKITDNSQYGASGIAGIIAYIRGDYNNPNAMVVVKNSYNEGELEYSKTSGNIAGIIGTAEYLNIELISNCYNTTNIDKDNTKISENIGGIIGWNSGKIYKIEKCYNTGNIKNGYYVGGIVGYTSYNRSEESNTLIEDCYNTGTITESRYIGGIIGSYYNSSNNVKLEIKKCNNIAELKGFLDSTASSNSGKLSNAAGIIGIVIARNAEMEINECYNKGNISSSRYSGGIVGELSSALKKIGIYKCFNEGTIKRENLGYNDGHTFSAGIIPYIGTGNLEIDSCYNIGKIISFSEYAQAGGIVGSISGKNSTIKNSYNTGEIELPYGGRDAGGIASYTVNTNVTNCYNTGNIKIGTSSEEKPEIKVPNISYGSSGLVSIGSGIWSGGILGYATETKVEDCYNTGNIICKAEALNKDGTEEQGRILIGGLIGALYSTNNGDSYVKRCYNTAQITIEAQKQYVAGVIGFYWWWNCDAPEAVYYTDSNYKFASNDYNDMNTTEGRLKTIDELKQESILNLLNQGRNTWKKGANGLPTINM